MIASLMCSICDVLPVGLCVIFDTNGFREQPHPGVTNLFPLVILLPLTESSVARIHACTRYSHYSHESCQGLLD